MPKNQPGYPHPADGEAWGDPPDAFSEVPDRLSTSGADRESSEGDPMIDTATCLKDDCDAAVERIERYKTTVVWERDGGSWTLGTYDQGTHFHLFCEAGHETRCWANPDPNADGTLPESLVGVVYPGEKDGTYRLNLPDDSS